MRLSIQLGKAGVNKLLDLIGKNIAELLRLRGLKQFNSQSLAEIIVKINGEETILCNKKVIEVLIDTLKPIEIIKIIQDLQLKISKDPWSQLKKLNFKKNSSEVKLFYKLFGVSSSAGVSEIKILPNPEIVIPNRNMFDYQTIAISEIKLNLRKPIKKVLLHMPTGSGKTRTAMALITDFIKERVGQDTVVVWLAHTEELCQQAFDEFKNTWMALGNRRLSIYKLFKKDRHDIQKISDGLIVMSLDLAYSLTKSQQSHFFTLSRRTNFIVMDEAHMAVAPSYKLVLDILCTKGTSLVGLTATPGRSYLNPGEDIKLRDFFNKQKVSIKIKGYDDPIKYLQDEKFLAKTEYSPVETNLDIKSIFSQKEINFELNRIKNGQDLSESFLKKIGADLTRANIIIEQIKKESLNYKNKIIVFASSVESAETIYSILFLEGINSACITSNTNPILRREYIEQFKTMDSGLNILLNYGVLTTGFDAPKANVAIIARPTQSVSLYSQMVGRVMRGPNANGKDKCKIITVKDPIHGFRDMGESFKFWEDIWK